MRKVLIAAFGALFLTACSGMPMFGAEAPQVPKEGHKLVCETTGGWGIGSWKFGGDEVCEEVPLEDS